MISYKIIALRQCQYIAFEKNHGPFQVAVDIWKRNHPDEQLPPIPNCHLKFPIGIAKRSISQLQTPADIDYAHSWFSKEISRTEKAMYKHTYGVSSAISLARKELIDQELSGGYNRFLCYATGNFVERSGELHADHVHSKDDIKQRIFALIEAMNQDQEFATAIIDNIAITFITDKEKTTIVTGKDLFIINTHNQYCPTRLLVMSFRNEVSNLILSKSVDNQDKGTLDPEIVLSTNKFYSGFLDKYHLDRTSIIFTVIDKETSAELGLGTAMHDWFFEQHSWMLAFLKANITISDMFNERIQRIFSLQTSQESQFEVRLLTSRLRSVQTFVQEFIPTPSTSSHSSSEDELDIKYQARHARRIIDKLGLEDTLKKVTNDEKNC